MPDETPNNGQENCPLTPQQLEQLYLTHYPTIRASMFEAYPSLPFAEADAILERLSLRLHRFTGAASDFGRLATQYALNWARHQTVFLDLATKPENVRAVEAAIHREMFSDLVDKAIEPSDVRSEIVAYLYTRCNSFLVNREAKTTTRLYSLTKRHIDLYHNKKRFRRVRAVTEQLKVGHLGVETLSELELASMKADEQEDDAA